MKRCFTVSTAIVLVISAGVAGCSQHSSPPRHDDGYYTALAGSRSQVVIVQFGIDTMQLNQADLGPNVLENGVVVDGANLLSWFDDQKSRQLATRSTVTLKTEAERAAGVIQMTALAQPNADRKRKTSPISADEAGRVAVLQALADGNLITRSDAGPAFNGNGLVVAGPAVDAWFNTHADQPLVPGAAITVRGEVARFAAEIGKPDS